MLDLARGQKIVAKSNGTPCSYTERPYALGGQRAESNRVPYPSLDEVHMEDASLSPSRLRHFHSSFLVLEFWMLGQGLRLAQWIDLRAFRVIHVGSDIWILPGILIRSSALLHHVVPFDRR